MKLKIKLKKEKKSNILDHINIPETTGDVLDFKPFNLDKRYASSVSYARNNKCSWTL